MAHDAQPSIKVVPTRPAPWEDLEASTGVDEVRHDIVGAPVSGNARDIRVDAIELGFGPG